MQLMGSERSLASGLELAVRIAWILGLVGGIFILAGPLVLFATPEDSRGSPPLPVKIHGSSEGLEIVRSRTEDFSNATLIAEQAMLEFQPATLAVWVPSYIAMWLLYGLTLLILHRLMKITRTLTAGRPFTPDNAARIRTIGLAVTSMWVLELAGQIAIQQFARRNFVLEYGSFSWAGDRDLRVLFLGLLILVISEVFRVGTRLQEDHDATI